jgi:putative FmdB family regulatory protein
VPTYQYVCTECGTPLEAVQAFSDPALTECPTCGGRLRKVFSAVGVVFKGSGFYRTDSRKEPAASNGSGKKSADSATGGAATSTPTKSDGGSKDTSPSTTPATTSKPSGEKRPPITSTPPSRAAS